MKQLLFIIVLILILINIAGFANANYYDLKMSIGESTSKISNRLFLDYQFQVKDYKLESEVKINKDYRFLSGNRYEEDWEFDDYFLRVTQDDTEIELGETKGESLSTFLSTGNILGISVKQTDYNFWYGRNANEDFSFGGQSSGLDRLGFSYDGKRQKMVYQYQEELVTDRHYLSYQNGYKLDSYDLLVDTAVVGTEQEIGSAVKLDLSSWYRGISYRWIAKYYTPEFQDIEQQIFSSGEYDLGLQTYTKLGKRYMLESDVEYSQDNLDNSQVVTNRDWKFNNRLSYFAPNSDIYQLGVNYQRNNYGSNQLDLNLSTEFDNLDLDLNYEQQENKRLGFEANYEQENYNYSFSYDIDKKDGEWNRNAEGEIGYRKGLTAKLESNSIINLSYFSDDYRVNITQGLRYEISKNHAVDTRLSLNHYFGSDEYTKKLIFKYRYSF